MNNAILFIDKQTNYVVFGVRMDFLESLHTELLSVCDEFFQRDWGYSLKPTEELLEDRGCYDLLNTIQYAETTKGLIDYSFRTKKLTADEITTLVHFTKLLNKDVCVRETKQEVRFIQ